MINCEILNDETVFKLTRTVTKWSDENPTKVVKSVQMMPDPDFDEGVWLAFVWYASK